MSGSTASAARCSACTTSAAAAQRAAAAGVGGPCSAQPGRRWPSGRTGSAGSTGSSADSGAGRRPAGRAGRCAAGASGSRPRAAAQTRAGSRSDAAVQQAVDRRQVPGRRDAHPGAARSAVASPAPTTRPAAGAAPRAPGVRHRQPSRGAGQQRVAVGQADAVRRPGARRPRVPAPTPAARRAATTSTGSIVVARVTRASCRSGPTRGSGRGRRAGAEDTRLDESESHPCSSAPSDSTTVSAIGLGGMPMSIEGRPDRARSIATIHAALDAGRHADRHRRRLPPRRRRRRPQRGADRRGAGLVRRRHLATCWSPPRAATCAPATARWTLDGSPEHLRAACEASLKRLGVEAIGLYQFHRPDPKVPYAESVGALARPARRGQDPDGRASPTPTRTRSALANEILGGRLVSVQNQFSPAFRSSEPELRAVRRAGHRVPALEPARRHRQGRPSSARHAAFADGRRRATASARSR